MHVVFDIQNDRYWKFDVTITEQLNEELQDNIPYVHQKGRNEIQRQSKLFSNKIYGYEPGFPPPENLYSIPDLKEIDGTLSC